MTPSRQSRLKYEFRDELEWIRVIDVLPERHRYLHFQESIQGVMSLDAEAQPILEYIGLMLEAARLLQNDPYRVLIGGLGSCTLLHAVTSWLGQNARVIAVESSQMVLDIAKRFFRLDPRQKVLLGDLRERLNSGYLDRIDLAFIDCYTADHMPHHLMTLEFVDALFACLQPGGVAVLNIWSPDCNPVCAHQLRTLAHCFDEVSYAKCLEDQNFVVMVRKPSKQDHLETWPNSLVWKRRAFPVLTLREHLISDWKGFLYGAKVIEDASLEQFVRMSYEFQPR